MSKEIWKDCKDAESYEISNKGRLKNKDTKRILKPLKNNMGYYQFLLRDKRYEKGYKHKLVHRLVAEHFIDKTDEDIKVGFIEKNPKKWCDFNLFWSNQNITSNKPVVQYSNDGKKLNEFGSMLEASKYLISKGQTGGNDNPYSVYINISNVCREVQKTAYGYKWKYKERLNDN